MGNEMCCEEKLKQEMSCDTDLRRKPANLGLPVYESAFKIHLNPAPPDSPVPFSQENVYSSVGRVSSPSRRLDFSDPSDAKFGFLVTKNDDDLDGTTQLLFQGSIAKPAVLQLTPSKKNNESRNMGRQTLTQPKDANPIYFELRSLS